MCQAKSVCLSSVRPLIALTRWTLEPHPTARQPLQCTVAAVQQPLDVSAGRRYERSCRPANQPLTCRPVCRPAAAASKLLSLSLFSSARPAGRPSVFRVTPAQVAVDTTTAGPASWRRAAAAAAEWHTGLVHECSRSVLPAQTFNTANFRTD